MVRRAKALLFYCGGPCFLRGEFAQFLLGGRTFLLNFIRGTFKYSKDIKNLRTFCRFLTGGI